MKKLIVLLLLLPFTVSSQSLPDSLLLEINRRVEQKINPSISIGILHADGPKSYYNFGQYQLGGIQPADSSTLYEIGSVTKIFTATLLEQKLDLRQDQKGVKP